MVALAELYNGQLGRFIGWLAWPSYRVVSLAKLYGGRPKKAHPKEFDQEDLNLDEFDL